MKNRLFISVSVLVSALALASCTEGEAAGGNDTSEFQVGVSLVSQDEERWLTDGPAIEERLQEHGHAVDLQYASYEIPTQQQQIEQMITNGADLLVIAPIDGTALQPQLQAAADMDIPVIAYDRFIENTEDLEMYITFDNELVGASQAEALLMGLGVLNGDGERADADGPFRVELFAGSTDDNNAHLVYQGAMSVLEPYIEDGTIDIPSDQTGLAQIATQDWSQQEAQNRMDDLLTAHYNNGESLDAVLTPNDQIARGVAQSLRNNGFGPTLDESDKPMPVLTGQDAEISAVKSIVDGIQYSTIFKNTLSLAEQAADSADLILNGETPEINDTETYDNGAMIVPTYLHEIQILTEENVVETLTEAGYYTESQIEAGQL